MALKAFCSGCTTNGMEYITEPITSPETEGHAAQAQRLGEVADQPWGPASSR
jgi:hypothetical protein